MKLILSTAVIAMSLVSASSAAADASIPVEFSQVAKAVALADSCEVLGYSVDRDGIIKLSDLAKQEAVNNGWSAAEAKEQLSLKIEQAFFYEAEQYVRAERMSHSYGHVVRHNRFLEKRCDRLSSDISTAALFVRRSRD